jgi:hypothetical protein
LAIQERFLGHRIALQIDPFNVGDNVFVRMQTFRIEALIFLLSPESITSSPCQAELKSARRQRLPICTIHMLGPVPIQMKKFTYWKIPPLVSQDFVDGIDNLATAIRSRVLFRGQLRMLFPDNTFHELIDVAQGIALKAERTLLAESACELAMKYCKITDPSARYWIALALGKADTPRAARLLGKLPSEDHPFALEGIRQAKGMLRHSVPASEL